MNNRTPQTIKEADEKIAWLVRLRAVSPDAVEKHEKRINAALDHRLVLMNKRDKSK